MVCEHSTETPVLGQWTAQHDPIIFNIIQRIKWFSIYDNSGTIFQTYSNLQSVSCNYILQWQDSDDNEDLCPRLGTKMAQIICTLLIHYINLGYVIKNILDTGQSFSGAQGSWPCGSFCACIPCFQQNCWHCCMLATSHQCTHSVCLRVDLWMLQCKTQNCSHLSATRTADYDVSTLALQEKKQCRRKWLRLHSITEQTQIYYLLHNHKIFKINTK